MSLVNGFASYAHTLLLRSRLFQQHVSLWPWPSDDLDIQYCSLTICVKVLFISYNLFISWHIYFILSHNIALVKTFTLICHIVTSNGRETFTCVEKLGEKYKNLDLMLDQHFPLVEEINGKAKVDLFFVKLVPDVQNIYKLKSSFLRFSETCGFRFFQLQIISLTDWNIMQTLLAIWDTSIRGLTVFVNGLQTFLFGAN